MRKFLQFTLLFSAISAFSVQAQVSITSIASPYTQDFNTLANTGTSNVLPTGWFLSEAGTNSNDSYIADIGSANAGNTFSYGISGETERALGSLRSGTLQSTYGVNFVNNSGSVITSIAITYTGEQWRLGTVGRKDTIKFHYSIDATSLNSGIWTNVTTLDFTTPATAGPTGAYVGNAIGNKTTLSFTISGLNIANGDAFWLRWADADATGADDGLAIDDVLINFNGTSVPSCSQPVNQPTVLNLTPTPTSISGSFTASAPVADQYLIVRSTNTTLSASPVDATSYTVDQAFGGGKIVSISSANSFTDAGLLANTTYYYFVFAFNSEDCLNGPNYLSTTPLSSNATTLALPACSVPVASPTALNLTPANNTILGSFTASASANRYLVVRSINNSLGATPVNGTTYTIGQSLGNGVVVDYTAGTSFVANGLTVATQYYFYVFAVSAECSGEPFYRTTALTGNITTTNTSTGIPTGYYTSAQQGQTCAALKTALKNIISANTTTLTYTPGVWNAIQTTDLHRNDANTADIIWDIYSDNPTGPEPYTFTYITDQCGEYNGEGICYNREHSFPQEWFGSKTYPMYSDLHHVFPTDGRVNSIHDSNPYGEVASPVSPSPTANGSKLGPNSFGCYNGTVFEPINAYKGDIARAQLYMITRYEDNMVAWQSNGTANAVLNGTTYPSLDDWYIQLLLKWHRQDPVSQKEIDRNNAIYALQGNRNPFVDIPSFADNLFTCVTLQCVIPVKLINFAAVKNTNGVLINWTANQEIDFKNYEIQRSIDGINFFTIGTVAAQNIPSYSFTDNIVPVANVNVYYRLKMIDIDGRSTFSKIASVRFDIPSVVSLYPNPAANFITIKFQQSPKGNSIINITDVAGRTVLHKNITTTQNTLPVNIEKLAAGKYFITIQNDGALIRDSFIKLK